MIFKQNEDGSCDIEFSKEEIEILNKKRKLHLSNEALNQFGTELIKMAVIWNQNKKNNE